MIWTHNLSPFIFRVHINGVDIGPRWYGLAYVIGFILGYGALKKAWRAGRFPGLAENEIENLMLWIVGGVVFGGRLGYCVQNMGEWSKDPFYFFHFNQGGMAFFGGLVGVALVLVWFSRKRGVSFLTLGDVCSVPAALGLGIGRIANFINGELPGNRTDGSWGVIFPNIDPGHPRHPSVLYEMATHFVLAGVLIWAGRQPWANRRAGVLSALFVLVYGLLRVVTEAFREADTYVGPLTNGQAASLVIAALGAAALAMLFKQKPPLAAEIGENLEKNGEDGNGSAD